MKEIINTEILISSLLTIGFERVDSILFVYVLGTLPPDKFDFKDEELSPKFNRYIQFNGTSYILKDEIVPNNNSFRPLSKILNTNEELIEYLESKMKTDDIKFKSNSQPRNIHEESEKMDKAIKRVRKAKENFDKTMKANGIDTEAY